jgi:hypothetical protein
MRQFHADDREIAQGSLLQSGQSGEEVCCHGTSSALKPSNSSPNRKVVQQIPIPFTSAFTDGIRFGLNFYLLFLFHHPYPEELSEALPD